MARAVADRLAREAGIDGMAFDSAGVRAKAGESAEVATIAFMMQEKIHLVKHQSKPLTEASADAADVILAMTNEIAQAGRAAVGDYYAPKIVLLNDAVEMVSSRMDVPPPDGESGAAHRRVYAALRASIGRLCRMLEESDVRPELFGALTIARRHVPSAAGPRASTLDPEKRLYLANTIFDLLERAFDTPTSAHLLELLAASGQRATLGEVEEILRQDLHGFVGQDRDGAWTIIAGAAQQRRDRARAEAQARARSGADQGREQKRSAPPPPPSNGKAEKMTEPLALDILGLKPGAPFEEIRARYRSLLKRYHPDRFQDDADFRDMAEAKARRINEAWNFMESKHADAE